MSGMNRLHGLHRLMTIFVVFRYNILAAAAVANAKNDKAAAKSLFEIVGLEAEKYRLGHTKASNEISFFFIPVLQHRNLFY